MINPKYHGSWWHRQQRHPQCYLGLLALGKNDFEAVNGFRSQCFAHQALGLLAEPSGVTLRHRFGAMGTQWSEQADQFSRALLGLRINGASIEFDVLPTGHVPLDIDTCVMEQSDTAKQGVSWTCAGVEAQHVKVVVASIMHPIPFYRMPTAQPC